MNNVQKLSDSEIIRIAQQFIFENKQNELTLRNYAKIIGVSKSTLHNYFKSRLKGLNYNLWLDYLSVADKNKEVGRVKGGISVQILKREKRDKNENNSKRSC